jgi:hypothetical protein
MPPLVRDVADFQLMAQCKPNIARVGHPALRE